MLADAPVKNGNGVPVEHIENARKDEVSPTEVYYYWSAGYFTRVYLALHNVVVMDGVGPSGWEVARWMIYDEVRHARDRAKPFRTDLALHPSTPNGVESSLTRRSAKSGTMRTDGSRVVSLAMRNSNSSSLHSRTRTHLP